MLSESSLFVYAHKVVVKTCGRTTLLRCMRKLLSVATRPARAGGLGLVLEWVGYSRKNYNFPADQPAPHGSFDEELAYLKARPPRGRRLFEGASRGAGAGSSEATGSRRRRGAGATSPGPARSDQASLRGRDRGRRIAGGRDVDMPRGAATGKSRRDAGLGRRRTATT